MNKRIEPWVNLFVDLTGIPIEDLWCPDINEHKAYITDNGIVVFDLQPYVMTQIVIGKTKTQWYYVDTGHDGHAILGFTQAKKVLEQSIEWHQEAQRRHVEELKAPADVKANEEVNWNMVTRERKAKIACAINTFGDGQHAKATALNLQDFCTTYLINCLMSGVELNQKLFEENQS